MIHTTTWRPDTCDCIIEYTWDDQVPESERKNDFRNIVKRCPAHSELSSLDIYSTVLEENPRKNFAFQHVLDNGPAALSDTTPEGAKVLKQNLTYNFSWSGTAPDRVLTISFTGISLTTTQRNAIQTFLNNRFGSGKVILA
jgi:hypothetical protein